MSSTAVPKSGTALDRPGMSLGAPVWNAPAIHKLKAASAQSAVLLVNEGPQNYSNRRLIGELTGNIPAMYPWREYVEVGGLMAYTVELEALFQYMAGQVASIFNGTKVGEIPVYQARTFKLVINLRAAKTLRLTVPPSLLARVDEVIE